MLEKIRLEEKTARWIEEDRGIPVEIAAAANVVTVGGHPAFEFRRNGELLYRKVRVSRPDGSKTFRRDRSGTATCLWNVDCLAEELFSEETPLIITEGELDALAWMASGVSHVVSVPDGAQRKEVGTEDIDPLNDTGFAWLWGEDGKLLPELRKFNRIVLSVDNDHAGQVLREELAIRLGPKRCWFIPSYGTRDDGAPVKDANEVLLRGGADALVDLLVDGLRPVTDETVKPIIRIPSVLDRRWYEVGWNALKPLLRLTTPELCVITGEPGAGKSQFALGLCCEMARIHGLKSLVIQFEDHISRLQKDIMAYAHAWSWCEGRDRVVRKPDGSETRLLYCDPDPETWAARFLFGVVPPDKGDDEPEQDLVWIREKIEEAVLHHNVKIVLLDPWNEIEHCWKVNENETQYTNKALKQIKSWARRLNICIIIVAHPSKDIKNKNSDDQSLYVISGSAAWNNKADHGVILMRDPDDTAIVRVKVSKVKEWGLMGSPGTGTLKFNAESRVYTTLSR